MKNLDTVLVLGAGASMDYGFPSGEQLIEDIVNILEGKIIAGATNNKMSIALIVFFNNFKDNPEETYERCYRDVVQFSNRLVSSSSKSIDDFLHNISKDGKHPNYALIGKICIVTAISRYENKEENFSMKWVNTPKKHRYFNEVNKFYKNTYSNRAELPVGHLVLNDGWYNYLWNQLYTDKSIEAALKKLTIITFNYERSLEYFLHNRLMNLLGLSSEDSSKMLRDNLAIHHVYGTLGNLFQIHDTKEIETEYKSVDVIRHISEITESLKGSRNFPQNITPSNFDRIEDLLKNSIEFSRVLKESIASSKILEICNQIRTYTEAAEKKPQHVYDKVKSAKRIFFLGFGYHRQNLTWLNNPSQEFNGTLFGTTLNLGKTQMINIKRTLKSFFSCKRNGGHVVPDDIQHLSEFNSYKIQDYFINVEEL